jgi:uncharacterized RDD family membrane protein YckC
MNWYYVDAGQQAGPVDDAQLESLRASGKIQRDTLIWCEGMTNWQAYGEVKQEPLRMASGAPSPGAAPAAAMAGGNEAVCAECNGVFNVQDMIRHGNMYVCANCKPIFMQKLAEGARLNTGAFNYASVWTRFAAVFIDGLILGAVNAAFGVIAGAGAASSARNPNQMGGVLALQLVLIFIQMAIAITYETVMIGKYGATLGKMACKIQVITADGGKVSYMRALGRYFAKLLSSMICLIGYIMAFFDDEKRALHDRICNTRVVLKQ